MDETATVPLTLGRYRHYKGHDYEVLTEAQHTETGEVFVVYKALYGQQSIWIRPRDMFCSKVETGGREVPRFRLVV